MLLISRKSFPKLCLGFGVVGEYFGWWDHFRPLTDRWLIAKLRMRQAVKDLPYMWHHNWITWSLKYNDIKGLFHRWLSGIRMVMLSSFTRNNPADMVEMVQKDDTTTWRAINLVRRVSWLVIIQSTFILHHLLDIAWHQYPSAIGHWLAKVGCDERTVLQKVWGNYARWLEDDDQRWSIWQERLWPGP